jgi:hypothetical protein
MDANKARKLFEELQRKAVHVCPLPMNKQKGDKAKPS